jgi:hypothetical protein
MLKIRGVELKITEIRNAWEGFFFREEWGEVLRD